MKRITIEGNWQKDPGGFWHLMDRDGRVVASCYSPEANPFIEDIPDPLPTEPGTRFWGKADGYEPQWWFVREGVVDRVWYVPSGLRPISLHSGEVSANGLVRLPDPS